MLTKIKFKDYDEVYNAFIKNPNSIKFRTSEVQIKYNQKLKELKEQDISTRDYLIDKYFNEQIFALWKNEFPYDLPEDCEHWIFATLDTSIKFELIPKNQTKFFIFENLNKDKSVKDLYHIHIISYRPKNLN